MLINLDAKSLEWVTACYLSGDKIGREELASGVDLHSRNQIELALPTRTVAKVFLFRTIYCDETSGGAYGFSHDPEFAHVSSSNRFWQKRIDTFFTKYSGIAKWHEYLLKEVGASGRLQMPYGREYPFFRKENKNGDKVWPKTQIYNYPVQGLGAELMAIVRVSLGKRLNAIGSKALLRSTVHDSVLIDAPKKEVDIIVPLIYNVFRDVPRNFEKLFSIPFDMELKCEVTKGPNLGEMKLVSL
jgi:DNA polymerase I-like protein with 3'-5' exonuclease and polymerase domains